MRTLWLTIRPAPGERGRLILAVLLAAAATGAAIALLATSGYLITRAAQRPMIISLMVAITAVRAFGLARAVLRYLERLASHDFALRALARLRARFYRRLVPLGPGELRGHSRGDLLSRFVADVDTLQEAHLRVLIPGAVAVAVILGAGLAGWLMLSPAGLVMIGALLLTAALSAWTSERVAAAAGRRQASARAALTGGLVEALDGSAELALAGRGRERAHALARADAALASLARRDALAGSLASGLQALLTGGGLLAVLLVGIAGVRSGALPGVLLAALAFLYLGAGEALLPLPLAARRLRPCAAAAARLEEVCAARPGVLDPAVPVAAPAAGALALEGVSLRYGPEEPWVLDRADLRVRPGERAALVGASGAGKSTVAELLVRFLDPDHGRVTLGGIDVRRLSQEELRRVVLLCDQDAHLFNTTIRENLLVGRRGAGEAELWRALRAVELEAWVTSLPHGLDTMVGQQGELVSGGQRRRLALARALLADARFLILDEPTAHLDPALARRVMAGVLEHAAGRGLLVITHAPDALAGFDRLLVLERGRLRSAGAAPAAPTAALHSAWAG